MSGPNRAQLIGSLHKTLKKAYAAPEKTPRSTLEHLLFAGCLENTHSAVAEKAFSSLLGAFYDLNEIRVSSVQELAETLSSLPDPAGAAGRVKNSLQYVFEDVYAFDLEALKKETLGAAETKLKEINGSTAFTIAYVTQMALDGHSVPIDDGALKALFAFGVITGKEFDSRQAPGVTRAVPKAKGKEFGGLLHEAGADFYANEHAPHLIELVQHVNPESPWLESAAPRTKAAAAKKSAKPKTAAKTQSKPTTKTAKTAKSTKPVKTAKRKATSRRATAKPR